MLFFAAVLVMIVIASLLSQHGVSAARKKWTIISMATIFYPFVLWEMREMWSNPMFVIFPLGMLISYVYLFYVDWRQD